MNAVELLNLKPVNVGCIRGFASVRVGVVTLHRFRIIQATEGNFFVGTPFIQEAGKRHFIVELEPQVWQEVKEKILSAWEGIRAAASIAGSSSSVTSGASCKERQRMGGKT